MADSMSIPIKEPCPRCKENPGKSVDGRTTCSACGGSGERQTSMPFEKFVKKVAEELRSGRGE